MPLPVCPRNHAWEVGIGASACLLALTMMIRAVCCATQQMVVLLQGGGGASASLAACCSCPTVVPLGTGPSGLTAGHEPHAMPMIRCVCCVRNKSWCCC